MQPAPSAAISWETALHERLLAGDVTAPAELMERYLEPLTRRLLGSRPKGPDTHLIEDAAIEALMSYAQRPRQYDAARGKLEPYLVMSAKRDLANGLAKEHRQTERTSPLVDPTSGVELPLTDGNTSVEDEALDGLGIELPNGLDRAEALRLIEAEFPDAGEWRVLSLIVAGVRETAAYVPLLGIVDLPAAEQRRLVKQVKDRLTKRLERLRAALRSRYGETP